MVSTVRRAQASDEPQMKRCTWGRVAPVVLMMQMSMAPSSASSGKASLRRSRVWYACARASGEPRVPMRTGTRGLTSADARTAARRAAAGRLRAAGGRLQARAAFR